MDGLPLFLVRLVLLGAASAVLAEAAVRLGDAPLRLARAPEADDPLDRAGIGFLLGLGTAGALLLGLGLAGLFRAGAIGPAFLVLLAASPSARSRRSALLDAARAWPGPRVGLAPVAAALLPAIVMLTTPEFNVDSEGYHLGAPWQYLQAGRMLIENVGLAFHFPSHTDLVFAIPLLLGEERLARWLVAATFLAASAVVASEARRRGVPAAAWVVPLAVLAGGHAQWLVHTSKNDLPVSALVVAGGVLHLRGRTSLGALLTGFALAGKVVYGPLAAVWYLIVPPPRRRWAWTAVLLALPIAPWWAKTWLATGSPTHPFAIPGLPAFDWSPAHRDTLMASIRPFWVPGSDGLATLPGALWTTLRTHYLPVMLVLPGTLLAGRNRRPALALTLGMAAVLFTAHYSRYLIPAVWLLALLAALELPRLGAALHRWLPPLAGAACLAAVALSPGVRGANYAFAFTPLADVHARVLSSRRDAAARIAAIPRRPGGPPRRVLSLGEYRTHRFPARLLYGGMHGETPMMWKLIRESRDLDHVLRKVRQLGADRWLYNYVTVGWAQGFYRDRFPWDERTLDLYRAFCARHLRIAWTSRQFNFNQGGFYLFEVSRRPLDPPSPVAFLPGAEGVYSILILLRNAKRHDEVIRAFQQLVARFPEVLVYRNELGFILANEKRWQEAYAQLKPGFDHGLMDAMNLPAFGQAALHTGHLDEAEKAFRIALGRCPQFRRTVQVNLGGVVFAKALAAFKAGRLGRAAPWIDEAIELLTPPVPASKGNLDAQRRVQLAFAHGLRGDLLRRRGDVSGAISEMREALRIAPDARGADLWRRQIELLAGPSGLPLPRAGGAVPQRRP